MKKIKNKAPFHFPLADKLPSDPSRRALLKGAGIAGAVAVGASPTGAVLGAENQAEVVSNPLALPIILPSTDLEAAVIIAENMREAVFGLNMTMDQPLEKHPLTVSLGVACSHNLEPGVSLFELADQHLYSAKSAGRNRTQSN